MADVFVSYAKEDRGRAERIAHLLESCGWSVFRDQKITAGDDWRQKLQSELDQALAVVVLWSQSSAASTWVHEEAERGRARLVSVLIDDVPLPIGFSHLQAVDLIGWEGGRPEDVGRLVDAVAATSRLPPKHPPRPGRSRAQTLGIAAAVGVLAVVAVTLLVARWLRMPLPIMNQEIVLDTSSGMAAPFDTRPSKLAAAIEALRSRNLHPAENLALRAFGGVCRDDDESRLLVSFGTRRRNRIVSAADGLTPRGQPTLVSGVISALADVSPLPHTRRIVVITGHTDGCYEEAIRELKQRFDAQPKGMPEKDAVALEMRFIGLALPPAEKPRLQQISDAVDGKAYFPNTVAELNDVLEYVIEFEPAALHVQNVWKVVDAVVKSINDVVQNTNGRKFGEATQILEAGEASYRELGPAFQSLAGVQLSPDFARFYTLAAQNRSLQAELFAAGREWIQTGRDLPDTNAPEYEERIKKWNAAVSRWNDIVGKYNVNTTEMNRLTAEIVKQKRRTG